MGIYLTAAARKVCHHINRQVKDVTLNFGINGTRDLNSGLIRMALVP